MPKLRAVCVRCGELKADSLKVCGKCGFLPTSPQECAQSLILSECFDFGEEVVGLTRQELERASGMIRAGDAYDFDQTEVSRVAATYLQAKSITTRRLLVDGAKWLGPPVLLLIVFYVFIRVFR
jgi:hypothetical protein